MNIPQITSIDNALKIYYSHSELGNKEIVSLFGRLSSATITKLKKAAKEEWQKGRNYCTECIRLIPRLRMMFGVSMLTIWNDVAGS